MGRSALAARRVVGPTAWLASPLLWCWLSGVPALAQRPDASPPANSPLPLQRLLHQSRLQNGLDVIVVENHAAPLATVLLAVRNGAFTQDSAEDGLTHLYEHMLFRAYPGGLQGFVGAVEGHVNGATGNEVVYYFAEVESPRVDAAIKALARLVDNPDFSGRDLKEERKVVLDELHRYASDPEGQLERQVERLLWGRSWSRKDVTGDSSSLAGITVEQLRAIYARYYVPNNAALIVTGDVVYEQVLAEATQRFHDWRPGPDPFTAYPTPAIAARTSSTAAIVANDASADVTIRIALQGPSVVSDPPAACAADVLFEVLNEPTSAFQQRLVSSGLFQSVSVRYLTQAHVGPIEFVATTTPERAEEAFLTLNDELNGGLLEDVTDADLAIARKRRRVDLILTLEHAAPLAPELGFWWASAGMEYYLRRDDCLASQGLSELQRLVGTYVDSRPRVIGVLAPTAAVERLATWMQRGVH